MKYASLLESITFSQIHEWLLTMSNKTNANRAGFEWEDRKTTINYQGDLQKSLGICLHSSFSGTICWAAWFGPVRGRGEGWMISQDSLTSHTVKSNVWGIFIANNIHIVQNFQSLHRKQSPSHPFPFIFQFLFPGSVLPCTIVGPGDGAVNKTESLSSMSSRSSAERYTIEVAGDRSYKKVKQSEKDQPLRLSRRPWSDAAERLSTEQDIVTCSLDFPAWRWLVTSTVEGGDRSCNTTGRRMNGKWAGGVNVSSLEVCWVGREMGQPLKCSPG